MVKQYGVYWINLDPTIGSEVSKTRPCIIISPDELNRFIRTVIIAPLTHTIKLYPTRVICDINGDKGSVMLDQIKTVDKTRIGNYITTITTDEIEKIKSVINQMLC
ncbi:MAG: type toxin-antitoxin system PemK/MazF family toxin [Mucilaginibacter sp.]|nr:type toxin-antitoxin system PemK/MazF family toxin [Mucilaginibacter sp.]